MLRVKKISVVLAAALLATVALAPGASAATPTSLTTAQKAELKYIMEEEKLSRDVYNFLAMQITARKFSNIARSEQTHMNLVAPLLTKYKITNPTAGKAPGVFVDKDIQALYKKFTVEGSAGTLQAYAVGVRIETTDIASLKTFLAKSMPADVQTALDLLLAASYNHLEAYSM